MNKLLNFAFEIAGLLEVIDNIKSKSLLCVTDWITAFKIHPSRTVPIQGYFPVNEIIQQPRK